MADSGEEFYMADLYRRFLMRKYCMAGLYSGFVWSSSSGTSLGTELRG